MKKIIADKKYIIAFGIVLRIVYFAINLIIGGHHCDEAMVSINAASLANNLTDVTGERLPLYFDTWLTGGQSPMATYLSAFSVKLFGLNLFAVRLPMLVVSIFGFCALVGFARELFGKTKQAAVIMLLGCISPWMIFSSVFVLDCNYIAHAVIIAFYFLTKALNSRKTVYYILSMSFFAASFYSYMAAVLLVPVMLLVLYLTLIIKRKINFKEISVSVVSIVIFALPFILFGLVNVGVLKEFSVLGISFAKMPYYARESTVVFSNGFVGSIIDGFENLMVAALFIVGVDFCASGIGMNIFQFANLFGGVIFAFGTLGFGFSLFKNRRRFDFYQKAFCVSILCGLFFYCFSVNDIRLYCAFRLGVLSPLLIFFEGIGLNQIALSIKQIVKQHKMLYIYIYCFLFLFLTVNSLVFTSIKPKTRRI